MLAAAISLTACSAVVSVPDPPPPASRRAFAPRRWPTCRRLCLTENDERSSRGVTPPHGVIHRSPCAAGRQATGAHRRQRVLRSQRVGWFAEEASGGYLFTTSGEPPTSRSESHRSTLRKPTPSSIWPPPSTPTIPWSSPASERRATKISAETHRAPQCQGDQSIDQRRVVQAAGRPHAETSSEW